jgi:site-specific DNA-methyltransferase (adenine-specific)
VRSPELKIHTEDLLDRAPGIPDCSVDMIFTSPPYKRRDGYSHDLMEALGEVVGRVLRPGGRAFMNFAQLREGFARPYEARDIVETESGLEAGQTICWVKSLVVDGLQRGHYTPITMKSPTLNYGWEPIFTYYKPPELALSRLSLGVPFADKSNMKRGTRGKHGDLHCAGDVWFLPYRTTGKTKKKATAGMGNAYSFPVELPLRAIKLSNLARGCVIFDPFMGSGTTAVAARQLGMHAWGIEQDPGKVPVIQQRWKEVGHESKETARVDL